MLQEPHPPSRSPASAGNLVSWIAVVIVVLLMVAVAAIGFVGARGYYVLAPGNAPVVTASSACRSVGGGSFALANGTPCVQLVVPSVDAHTVDGSIMMVDVLEAKPTPFQYLAWEGAKHGFGFLSHVYGSDQFLPNAAIIGSGSAAELSCEDTEQSVQATSAAPVAALRQLGYKVTESDLGAQIDEVVVGTPAANAGVECDDLVTAVDGKKVTTADGLDQAVRAHQPGQTIAITVQRLEPNGSTKTLTVQAKLTGTPAFPGQAAVPNRAFLGVVTETRTMYNLPVHITANVGAIGGPSDGLALALGFIDALGQGRLTNGLHIAATGEIDDQGHVIEIGGAAQKAVAVRHAGADLFLVPSANYAAAKSQAGSMKVLAVNTLAQALEDLKALGGTVPTATATAAGTTPGATAAGATSVPGPSTGREAV
jgi:PDZ domain-containing secreted protein